jgi:hypothetical protein
VLWPVGHWKRRGRIAIFFFERVIFFLKSKKGKNRGGWSTLHQAKPIAGKDVHNIYINFLS